MTDGLLDNIIALEKSIQAEVAREQARATAWRSREQVALQEALVAARADEELRCRQLLADHEAELLGECAALEESSSAWCERLSRLEDTALIDALKRHLAAILPGGDHDHPHGQG